MNAREFEEAYASRPIKEKTLQDFSFSQQMGVSGFPNTMLQTGGQYHLLTRGYADAEEIVSTLNKLIQIA